MNWIQKLLDPMEAKLTTQQWRWRCQCLSSDFGQRYNEEIVCQFCLWPSLQSLGESLTINKLPTWFKQGNKLWWNVFPTSKELNIRSVPPSVTFKYSSRLLNAAKLISHTSNKEHWKIWHCSVLGKVTLGSRSTVALSKTSYGCSLQVCKFTENNFKDKIDNNWILFCITNLNDGIQLMHQSSERSELRLHTQVTTSEAPLSCLGDRHKNRNITFGPTPAFKVCL